MGGSIRLELVAALSRNTHLRAAARFNSFSIWAGADNVAKFKSEKDASRDYFSNGTKN